MERCREASLGSDEVDVALHLVSQSFTGLVLAGECRSRMGAGIHLNLENCHDEIRALRGMAVDRAEADARPLRGRTTFSRPFRNWFGDCARRKPFFDRQKQPEWQIYS